MLNLLVAAIVLPIIIGAALLLCRAKNVRAVKIVTFAAAVCTSAITALLIFNCPVQTLTLVEFQKAITIGLKLDGVGKLFSGMVAFLWPFALLYAFVYMKHDARQITYYAVYLMTYGVVLGIAFSENALTLYIFYEMLTFITLPLINHTQNKESRHAGRSYLYYSLAGSSLALAGIIMITAYAGNNMFISGGSQKQLTWLSQLAYLFVFFGFGVKAAVFPLCGWLPMASAAPTPTTALLHAVAVVKAGAFAILRMTYFSFKPSLLFGSTAQDIAIIVSAVTIVYGSAKAVAEKHFKRRFAYSTVANLSYILFGIVLCTAAGLRAGLMHFVIHSFTKIGIFFACGAIIETTGATYVYQLNGLGKKMPVIFTLFTVSGLSLIGVPLFSGFVSKFYLIRSAFLSRTPFAMVGVGALIISAILTSVYVFSVTVRAFVRKPAAEYIDIYEGAKEPDKGFLWVTGVFSFIALALGIFATPLQELLETLLRGVMR